MKEESEQASLKLNIQKTKMIDLVSHFMAHRWGKIDSIFLGSKIIAVTAAMNLKNTCSLEEKLLLT